MPSNTLADPSDKLAAAILAAARCATLGTHEPAHYVEAYSEIEQIFGELRRREVSARVADLTSTKSEPPD